MLGGPHLRLSHPRERSGGFGLKDCTQVTASAFLSSTCSILRSRAAPGKSAAVVQPHAMGSAVGGERLVPCGILTLGTPGFAFSNLPFSALNGRPFYRGAESEEPMNHGGSCHDLKALILRIGKQQGYLAPSFLPDLAPLLRSAIGIMVPPTGHACLKPLCSALPQGSSSCSA